jgi:hypothetical protein
VAQEAVAAMKSNPRQLPTLDKYRTTWVDLAHLPEVLADQLVADAQQRKGSKALVRVARLKELGLPVSCCGDPL